MGTWSSSISGFFRGSHGVSSFIFHSQSIFCTACRDSASLWCRRSIDSWREQRFRGPSVTSEMKDAPWSSPTCHRRPAATRGRADRYTATWHSGLSLLARAWARCTPPDLWAGCTRKRAAIGWLGPVPLFRGRVGSPARLTVPASLSQSNAGTQQRLNIDC